MHIISHKLKLRSEQILTKKFNISFNGFIFLYILKTKGNQSQHSLSKFAGITPAATSKQVQLLFKKGFIKININLENRREHLVTITSKGKLLQQKLSNLLAKDFRLLFGNIKNMTDFEFILNKMTEILFKIDNNNNK